MEATDPVGFSGSAQAGPTSERPLEKQKTSSRISDARTDDSKADILESYEIFEYALSDATGTREIDDISNFPHAKEAYSLMLTYSRRKFGVKRRWEGAKDSEEYMTALRRFWVFCKHFAAKKKKSEQRAKEIQYIPAMDLPPERLFGNGHAPRGTDGGLRPARRTRGASSP